MEDLRGVPVFCVRTVDKKSSRKLYINFKSTDAVETPPVDLNEDQLVQEICNPSPAIEKFKIPLKLSQIFWSKQSESSNKERHYVIDVHINDKFAIRKVLVKDVIRHYVIVVTLQTIEDKYNKNNSAEACGQFLGHQLDLDQAAYEVLNLTQCQDRSSELVNNRVLLLGEKNSSSPSRGYKSAATSSSDAPYDLYYRPGSRILTCSIQTDKLPGSISFNDDRIMVECSGQTLVDVHLPIRIDLKEPMRYKFDDKLCLLRIVFRIVES